MLVVRVLVGVIWSLCWRVRELAFPAIATPPISTTTTIFHHHYHHHHHRLMSHRGLLRGESPDKEVPAVDPGH